ncbi:MAG: ZIP family metal transporter [Nanoarchaeota archaeon]|mgnify:FL=1
MDLALLQILIAVGIVSLISFVGALALVVRKDLNKILSYLVSFAAGSMLGAAFLDLLPGALAAQTKYVFEITLLGIILFFIIELYFHWHHHHTHSEGQHVHALGYLNLIGDASHNFIDGMIIAASFMVSFPLGIITTIAVIAHEIPQEIGDFGILIYSGFSKAKALFFNFLTALTAVLGALLTFFASEFIKGFTAYLIPFAAGAFIYMAAVDLMPELHKHGGRKSKSRWQVVLLFLGIILIYVLGLVFKH